jgi:hypothetical protein
MKKFTAEKTEISRKDAKTQRKDGQNKPGFTFLFATFAALRETRL